MDDRGTVRIVDATLREGAQAAGVRWTPETSAEIARALDALGVDTIECGHPAVGAAEAGRVRAVVALGLAAPVLAHARASEADVEAVAAAGAPWVGIFLGVNEISRRARVRAEIPSLLALIARSVRRAKGLGLRARFTLEDAMRTPAGEIAGALGAAVDAGADRIGLADTVGGAEPRQIAETVARVHLAFPSVPIEVHFHDDRGLAVANALEAIDAGAGWVATSVNGLGERCGIVDLASALANLAQRGLRPWPDGASLQALCRRVGELSGSPPDARRPVTGACAFTHVAKLHARAMERDPASYSWIDPRHVGRTTRIDGHD